jgi:peptidyl-prolyl cis-trans isomerase C
MKSTRVLIFAAAVVASLAGVASSRVLAEDKVVATVNGKALTEIDMKLAEAEIGGDLGNLPEATKRRVLIEYLIENQLFANAAESEKMGAGEAFDERMQYWRRRALRDTYFDKTIKDSVGEAAAKTFYDDQIKSLKPEEEVQARHILVESETQAKELADKIAKGADFAELAKEHSKDPGTKDDGGLLPFFSRGQMVPQFEEAAFKLKKGDVSPPVQSQFGWHLIKVEERREKQPPTFEQVKDRILASMIHRKAQSLANNLREQSKVEYVDTDIKKQVEDQEKQAEAQKKMFEEQLRKMETEQKK